jgi:hypothetical protein
MIMSFYSFRSIDRRGAVALSQNMMCTDDLAALEEGVRRSGKSSIEIWHGPRLVARVKLGNAALNAADLRCL